MDDLLQKTAENVFVNITELLGNGFYIYHVKSVEEPNVILSIEKKSFSTAEEAKIYCDIRGYTIVLVIEFDGNQQKYDQWRWGKWNAK